LVFYSCISYSIVAKYNLTLYYILSFQIILILFTFKKVQNNNTKKNNKFSSIHIPHIHIPHTSNQILHVNLHLRTVVEEKAKFYGHWPAVASIKRNFSLESIYRFFYYPIELAFKLLYYLQIQKYCCSI